VRPFSGFTTDILDQSGNRSFSIKQPMIFPVREKFYELLLPLCSKSGLYVTVETRCNTKQESLSLLTARQLPVLGKQST
jgi:ribosomal protein L5